MGKNHFVAADIGTSETRISADGALTLRIPNNCVFLEGPTDAAFSAGKGTLGALEAVIEGLGDKTITVLFGEMAARHSTTNLRPSPLEAKYKQEINLVSLIVGAALARLEKGNAPAELYLALPPVEVGKARTALKDSLGGEYRVEFPKLGRAARVKFTDIFCYEESRMAGVAFMSQLDEQYKEGTVLSVDIGAGTTDLALFVNGVFYERSAKTYKVGGNTAREFLIDDIASEYDCELPVSDAEKVIQTGQLKLGNTTTSVVENVNEAKRQFSNSLVESIQQYFRAVGVPIQTVNAFVVSGGGAMSSDVAGARSAVSYVVDALKQICPGVDTIEYQGDSRMANLEGLCITAKQTEEEVVAPIIPITVQATKKEKETAATPAEKGSVEPAEAVEA